ncbi:MAG: argininosuccinate lyase [Acidobacteriaceae bacterium]|nr:argininosuccinate lyase [Acidobacteriaceae bacterium]
MTGKPPDPKPRFPSPLYADTVLAVNFADAQRLFLDLLLEIHYAHTLMLARQGIISADAARACLDALDALDGDKLRSAAYDECSEDLFFYVHTEIERLCGEESGGRMHTARSRNDIDLTLYRMRLRREVLVLSEATQQLCCVLLRVAREHIHTLMPAYTHGQPAQPTTFAHYLLAAIECFGRDQRRLQAAFATINRSPLGACAITTTGFPIDRNYTAALLGFEGLQLNSYGAIAATDYVTETAGVIATAMVTLGRLVQDLLLWTNPSFDYLRLSDAWVQISSIMPQKRNPVALEHARILASKALAQAQGIFTAAHNTPFGDVVDSEDDLQPLVFSMTTDAQRAIRLLTGLMADCEIHVERLAERARGDFLTATELADTLTREAGLPFHTAHTVVSDAVHKLTGCYSPEAMIDAVNEAAQQRVGDRIEIDKAKLLQALDPEWFVSTRRVSGGPAPEAVEKALDQAEDENILAQTWIAEKQKLLEQYPARIRDARNSQIG